MKNAMVLVGLIAVVALVGCKKSEEGGLAGKDTFRLSAPVLPTTIKQGETQVVRVGVDRGAEFKQSVKLELKAPTGLQVDPNSTTVKASDKGDVQLTITAAKDAPLGDQQIMLKGTPDQGDPANIEFKITVSK